MSPTPIIELQRRLTLVGAIRAGGERPADGRRPGAKLRSWRLTSPRRELIEQAAELYGGSISPWRSPVGDEWQTYTEHAEIPVLVMPGYSLRQSYELWEGATKRTRLCDGVDEELSGAPCLCNAEGVDRCDVYSRLVVALPELDTVLGWRLISKGANAAHELPTMLALIEAKAGGQAFVPARLRLDERRGVVDGQVVRFVVPSIDLGVGYLALAAPRDADPLPRGELSAGGFTPTTRHDPSVDEAMSAVAAPPRASSPSSRSAAAFGPAYDEFEPEQPAHPVIEQQQTPQVDPHERERLPLADTLNDAQSKKLDVLVGTLRDRGGHITTESLYEAIAGLRKVGWRKLAADLEARDEAGVLHWAPLRRSLSRSEASQLIDWLSVKESRVAPTASVPEPQTTASTPVPYDTFPEGY